MYVGLLLWGSQRSRAKSRCVSVAHPDAVPTPTVSFRFLTKTARRSTGTVRPTSSKERTCSGGAPQSGPHLPHGAPIKRNEAYRQQRLVEARGRPGWAALMPGQCQAATADRHPGLDRIDRCRDFSLVMAWRGGAPGGLRGSGAAQPIRRLGLPRRRRCGVACGPRPAVRARQLFSTAHHAVRRGRAPPSPAWLGPPCSRVWPRSRGCAGGLPRLKGGAVACPVSRWSAWRMGGGGEVPARWRWLPRGNTAPLASGLHPPLCRANEVRVHKRESFSF